MILSNIRKDGKQRHSSATCSSRRRGGLAEAALEGRTATQDFAKFWDHMVARYTSRVQVMATLDDPAQVHARFAPGVDWERKMAKLARVG